MAIKMLLVDDHEIMQGLYMLLKSSLTSRWWNGRTTAGCDDEMARARRTS